MNPEVVRREWCEQLVSCVPLPALGSSVSIARTHIRALMEKWNLKVIADDVELVVSEIVTNAIKAVNIIPSRVQHPEPYDRLEMVCLCLYRFADKLVVEVWDPKREPPERRDVSPEDEGGRGLWLVESLAEQWGTRWPSTGGKIIWVLLKTTI